MSRFYINDELSFRYPKECSVTKKLKGQGFALAFKDSNPKKESYYFKFTNAKTAHDAWGFMCTSIFDKSYNLQPLKRDKKVAGFTLRKLPNLFDIKIGHGEYVSFRGSEYYQPYNSNTEWIELTWCRMYCRTVKNKPKIMSVCFTAAGEAQTVTKRLREHFMNIINGVIYKPEGVAKWKRVQFPVKKKRTKPVIPPPAPKPDYGSIVARGPRTTIGYTPPVTTRSAPIILPTKQCPSCSGSGTRTCSSCGGMGGRNESYTRYDWEGNPIFEHNWVSCYCSGGYESCTTCGGKGTVYK